MPLKPLTKKMTQHIQLQNPKPQTSPTNAIVQIPQLITQFTTAEKTWWAVGQERQNRCLPE
jgi:hypothetical protein